AQRDAAQAGEEGGRSGRAAEARAAQGRAAEARAGATAAATAAASAAQARAAEEKRRRRFRRSPQEPGEEGPGTQRAIEAAGGDGGAQGLAAADGTLGRAALDQRARPRETADLRVLEPAGRCTRGQEPHARVPRLY